MPKRALNPPFLLVRLLGPPRIEGPDGVVTGAPAQRHRLALLALLARVPHHVLSREKLVGMLWPEVGTASARQLLNVSVHKLRKALGDATLVSESDALRLDPERLRIDTIEFDTATARGELESAAALYTGPFLEGLALPDAVEFDHWADGERNRLERTYQGVLEQLAVRFSETGTGARAVEFWRERLSRTPADGRIVQRMMKALAQAGDRAGALQVASAHATLLAQEFDAEPDPAVEAMAAQLRRGELLPGGPVESQPGKEPASVQRTSSAPQSSPGPTAGAWFPVRLLLQLFR